MLRLSEKEIVKIVVSGLKPEVFREEIYSRTFETLVDVMAETRHEKDQAPRTQERRKR